MKKLLLAICLAGQVALASDAEISAVLAAADAEILQGDENTAGSTDLQSVHTTPSVLALAQGTSKVRETQQHEESNLQGKASARASLPTGTSQSDHSDGALDLPANFDAIDFLAQTEAAEEVATAAETDALQAQAQEARSRAWLWRAQRRQQEGQDSESASAENRAAEQSVLKNAHHAQELMGKAKNARQAVMQLTAKVAPELGNSHLVHNFGPRSCISTWKDLTSGNCFLQTQCSEVPGFSFYEVGFRCEAADQEPREHRFSAGSFAASELQDTKVQCQRCLPLPAKSVESLAQEVTELQSRLRLRGWKLRR